MTAPTHRILGAAFILSCVNGALCGIAPKIIAFAGLAAINTLLPPLLTYSQYPAKTENIAKTRKIIFIVSLNATIMSSAGGLLCASIANRLALKIITGAIFGGLAGYSAILLTLELDQFFIAPLF